jgi:hypothetical protein
MHALLIGYDLNRPGQNYAELIEWTGNDLYPPTERVCQPRHAAGSNREAPPFVADFRA